MRAWLVDRDYDDKGLVRLVYATPCGNRRVIQERSAQLLASTTVTVARDVDPDRLEPVDDAETRDRYRDEIERLRARYEPDDPI